MHPALYTWYMSRRARLTVALCPAAAAESTVLQCRAIVTAGQRALSSIVCVAKLRSTAEPLATNAQAWYMNN